MKNLLYKGYARVDSIVIFYCILDCIFHIDIDIPYTVTNS